MSPKGRPKQPRAQGHGQVGNPPPLPDFDAMRPVFSFERMVRSKCTDAEKGLLLDRLIRTSQHCWRDLKPQGNHSLGFETIPVGRFRTSIQESVPKDLTKLWSGHYSQKGRFAGFRIDQVFFVLVIDPEHTEY